MRFARFVVVGAANTALSYGVYLLLLLVIDYRVAYTVAYVAGLVFGYLAQARLVFRAQLGARSAVAYVATYAAMYLASVLMLWLAVDLAGRAEAVGDAGRAVRDRPAVVPAARARFRGAVE